MPYTGPGDESLPPNIKELPENDRARWANIWNSVYAECQDSGGEDCEGQAFKQANGSLKDNEQVQSNVVNKTYRTSWEGKD